MALFPGSWRSSLPTASDQQQQQQEIEKLRRNAPIPCLWLFGKTGSGKSSIVQFLTGAEEAVIGEGYRPETKTSRRFDFPNSLEPLLRFLDTRGLAEASYDPSEDLQRFVATTQLMIVAVRITDHALNSLLEPLRKIRRVSPTMPVLLVLTCLHEAFPGSDLTASAKPNRWQFDRDGSLAGDVPPALRTLAEQKLTQFDGLYDAVILIDLTKPEDGFANPNFGGPALQQAILDKLPHAYRQALLTLNQSDGQAQSQRHRDARWQVLASSALAATAGAVPVPWVDIPGVLAIQTHLAVRIAGIYEQDLTPARWAVLSSVAGTRIAIRMAVREALKFIPIVGMAVGAAGAFAFTYALGMSWDWYFADLRRGNVPSAEQLQEVFAEQLRRGHELWRAG